MDFKSVYKNGTSGIVVVAPSEGKTWVRKPWAPDASLLEIPADLLAAVAVPETVLTSLVIRCVDGSRVERNACRWVPAMAYFQPFLADDDIESSEDGGIPVPALVESSTLRELFHVLDRGFLSGQHPKGVTRATLGEVRRVADFLGLSERDTNRTLVTSISLVAQLDLADVCPAWSLSFSLSASASDDEAPVIPVDKRLSERLLYEPLEQENKDRWLFAGRMYASHALPLVEGDPVLAADPQTAMEVRIVEEGAGFILDVMRRHAGRVVLAGGGALWGVAAQGLLTTPSKHDYDLFVVSDSDAEATEIALDICESVPLSRRCQTSRAITLFCNGNGNGNGNGNTMVQVILRRYTRIQDVTRRFDFGPCKVAAWYDSPTDELLTIRADSDFVECMRHFAFWIDLRMWSYSTISRVLKYHLKGFEIFVPGTRREAFRKEWDSSGYHRRTLHSIADLFWIEKKALMNRKDEFTFQAQASSNLVKPMALIRDQLMGYGEIKTPVTVKQLIEDIFHQRVERSWRTPDSACAACGHQMYVIKDTDGIFGPFGKLFSKKEMFSVISIQICEHVQFRRLSEDEVKQYSYMCNCASDYSAELTMTGRLAFVVERMYAKAVRTLGGIGIGITNGSVSENEISWQTTDTIMNQRRVVNIPALYDMPSLLRVLADESRFSTGNASSI